MQLNITARHLDLTPALSDYVRKKLEKSERHFDAIVWTQAVLSVEKHRHIAELIVHTPGSTFRAQGEAGDLYSAIDLAAGKLDLHLSKQKDKQRSHRKRAEPVPERIAQDGATAAPSPEAPVSEVTRVWVEPASLTRAIRQLNSGRLPIYLFVNEKTNQINVLYKKGKDDYGLVEASAG